MAGGVWVRTRGRLRVFVRAAADAAVRRVAPAHVAAVVQYRRRTWPAAGAARHDSCPGPALPLRRRRTDGNDYPVGARRAYSVALDDRTRRHSAAVPLRMAGVRRLGLGVGDALDDAGRRCRRPALGCVSPAEAAGGRVAPFRGAGGGKLMPNDIATASDIEDRKSGV